MKKLHRFLVNALLLSAVALLMRTVGVIFQIYIANRVGAEALGLYGLFSGIYGFAVTFATSGVHLAATRLTAEALGQESNLPDVRRGMRRCFIYSTCFGTCAAVGLFLLSPLLAEHLLDEPRVILPMRILALALLPISLSSAMNGYFTACRRVYKNAIAQVSEQAVRIAITVFLLTKLFSEQDPARACVALVLGSTAAEILSSLFSALLYLFDRRRYPHGRVSLQDSRLTRKLCEIALPVAFSAYIRSGLLTLEHALIPQGLRKSGASRTQALESYGILNSMVFPIILFPTALIGSFSGLLVPELAECRERGNRREITYIAGRVYSLALWFSIGTAAVLSCYAQEFGLVIYGSAEAARYIRRLAPLIPLMYLDSTTDAMLKGLGEQVYTMTINIADSLISVILVWALLPRMGIEGYILTVYIAELFNTACSVARLLTVSGVRVQVMQWIFKPLLCAIGATSLSSLLAYLPLFSMLPPIPALCLHVLLTVMLYLSLLGGIHAIDQEAWIWLRKLIGRADSERYSSQNSPAP